MKDNNAVVIPIKTVIVMIVVICIVVLFVWIDSLKVTCNSEDKVELKGLLRGFERTRSFWTVRISNQSYVFGVFDSNYMQSMIGFNITVNTCFRHGANFQIEYYDMINCFITEAD